MKKQYIILFVLFAIVGVIIGAAISKYDSQPKGITAAQAISQRDTALIDLQIQKELNKNDQVAISNLTDKTNTLTDEKTTLCAQIKAAKLVQPLCK
jgi:hypothetical protein